MKKRLTHLCIALVSPALSAVHAEPQSLAASSYVTPAGGSHGSVVAPCVDWGTFFGGLDHETVLGLAVDEATGEVIIAGRTQSWDMPTPDLGAYDLSFDFVGNEDAYVARFSADGSTCLWSTYLGGSGVDRIYDLGLDDAGDIVLVGLSDSADFPTTAGAFDTSHNGLLDAFVARLSGDGTQLLDSTYLGGAADDWGLALDLGVPGRVTVVGVTQSNPFPTTPGAFDEGYNGGPRDVFMAQLSDDLTQLLYSTYLGGSADEITKYDPATTGPGFLEELDVVAESSGIVTLAGRTASSDFPVSASPYQTDMGLADGFIARLDPAGGGASDLLFSTYLGGNGTDSVRTVAVDALSNVYVGGYTYSASTFPTTPGAFDTTHDGTPGTNDAFVARLDPTLSSLDYSTFLGGAEFESVHDLLVHSGVMTVVGFSLSASFPTTIGACQPLHSTPGLDEGFVLRLHPGGFGASDLHYSTFLGGSDVDIARELVWDGGSGVTVGGITRSGDFPATAGAAFPAHSVPGTADAFVARLGLLPAGVEVYGPSTAGCAGAPAIGVNSMPWSGNSTFALTCVGADPGAAGFLGLGPTSLDPPLPLFGVELLIDPTQLYLVFTATADAVGYSEVGAPLPPGLAGVQVFSQFLWISACGSPIFSSSNAASVTIQP